MFTRDHVTNFSNPCCAHVRFYMNAYKVGIGVVRAWCRRVAGRCWRWARWSRRKGPRRRRPCSCRHHCHCSHGSCCCSCPVRHSFHFRIIMLMTFDTEFISSNSGITCVQRDKSLSRPLPCFYVHKQKQLRGDNTISHHIWYKKRKEKGEINDQRVTTKTQYLLEIF